MSDVMWWTSHGWMKTVDPLNDLEDWDEAALMGAGYSSTTFGDEKVCSFGVTVYDNARSSHAMIVVDSFFDKWLTRFFVSADDLPAFYADKLPQILQGYAAFAQAEAAAELTRALGAFIRHGHGETVFTEHFQTIEEVSEARRRVRERQKGKASST